MFFETGLSCHQPVFHDFAHNHSREPPAGCAGSIPASGSFFRKSEDFRKCGSAEDGKPFARVEGGSHHRVKGETPCQCPEADTGGPRRNPAQRFRWGEEEQGSERSFRRKAETELSGLCGDEGRVQGGSACWVSRGQSPLGLVQGDNACSGVQRVKPLAQ